MLLAIDVGNTNIKLALYVDSRMLSVLRLPTQKESSEEEIISVLDKLVEGQQVSSQKIDGIIIASVVPDINDALRSACERYLKIKPRFVGLSLEDEKPLAIPLHIKIDEPACLGADRIASSVGAIARYGNKLIIFNFGTATLCEVIGQDNDYLGGIIAPGINTSIKTLHEQTALLPAYKFSVPSKVIATSTEDALYGGIFYATIGFVEKMVQEIKAALPGSFKVIATGGLAQFVHMHTKAIDLYDPDLVTFGLYTIYLNNKI